MSERTPIERADALIQANPLQRAARSLGFEEGWVTAMDGNCRDNTPDKAAAYLLLAEAAPDPTTLLPRARDIAARVTDLNRLDESHPGLWSQEQVREERERLLGGIGRLMGGAR